MDKATLSRSLKELEGERWQAPNYDSYLVREAHRLRSIPIGDLTVEDLRLLIGQQVGAEWLMPFALDVLRIDPLAGGDFYPGDLLSAVLRVDSGYWSAHPEQQAAVHDVRVTFEGRRDGVDVALGSLSWPEFE